MPLSDNLLHASKISAITMPAIFTTTGIVKN